MSPVTDLANYRRKKEKREREKRRRAARFRGIDEAERRRLTGGRPNGRAAGHNARGTGRANRRADGRHASERPRWLPRLSGVRLLAAIFAVILIVELIAYTATILQ